MREIDLHVPFETIDAMGFDIAPEGFREVDLRDVTLMSCGDWGSIAAITYSEPVDDVLTDSDTIEWWERIDREGAATTYLCEVVAPRRSADPSETRERTLDAQTVTVEDGGCTVTFVGDQEALQCDSEFVDSSDHPIALRRLTDYEGPRDELESLTRRQREVLETAYELGYYEVPRETTAADVARRLDVERATVTEHLQRAERNLLSTILSD